MSVPSVLCIKAFQLGGKTAIVDVAVVVPQDPETTTLSSFLQSKLSSDISFTDEQIYQIKVGTTDIKSLIPFPLSTVLLLFKSGANTITLKINAPRHARRTTPADDDGRQRTPPLRNGNAFLLTDNVWEFHTLETVPSYEDVIGYQDAEQINKESRASFIRNYEGKPRYDDQIQAIIAKKISKPDDTRLHPCGYYERRAGDDPFARGKSEKEKSIDGLKLATSRFISVHDHRDTLMSWGNTDRFSSSSILQAIANTDCRGVAPYSWDAADWWWWTISIAEGMRE